ncbi:hypothetical protein ACFLUW_01435 [Chloroflexota bacterium]
MTVKAIAKGKIPTLENLAIRKERGERVALANSLAARKIIKVTTIAPVIVAVSPKAAIVDTVVTVVTVVISVLLPPNVG